MSRTQEVEFVDAVTAAAEEEAAAAAAAVAAAEAEAAATTTDEEDEEDEDEEEEKELNFTKALEAERSEEQLPEVSEAEEEEKLLYPRPVAVVPPVTEVVMQQEPNTDVWPEHYIPFICNNGCTYKIYAAAAPNTFCPDDGEEARLRKILQNAEGERYVDMSEELPDDDDDAADGVPNRMRKHYYFYSDALPRCNRKAFIQKMVRTCNAALISDLEDWTNVPNSARFLIIDEYTREHRLSMGDLLALTSGDASAYCGKQYHGRRYRPRPEAQVIVFARQHLFQVMGDGHGGISPREADILLRRFSVARLNTLRADPDSSAVVKAAAERYCEMYDRLFYTDCEITVNDAQIRWAEVLSAAKCATAAELMELRRLARDNHVDVWQVFRLRTVQQKLEGEYAD